MFSKSRFHFFPEAEFDLLVAEESWSSASVLKPWAADLVCAV